MEVYEIENDKLRVRAKSLGAELTSFFCKTSNTEHLWQANPQFWNWHAPVLFPVVGRCWNDQLSIHGGKYPMEKHGFGRRSLFHLESQTDDSLTFLLQHSARTEPMYPFAFEFRITYQITANRLITRYTVKNPGYGELYFSLGAHPAFAVPFHTNESFNDYFVEFSEDQQLQRHLINEAGFFTGETREVLHGNRRLGLSATLFEEDALIFKNHRSRRISIGSTLHQHRLQVDFDGFPYLGIWTKPGAPYVCIEPWLGCADNEGILPPVEQKEGIIRLTGNRTWTSSLEFSIVEMR
ncbi:MAG: aldose 1-epimerase family protein [Chitinophagales bacterium]